ncbi:MAG: hypothetical protein R2830_18325 [Saprospiraceae bacterium]
MKTFLLLFVITIGLCPQPVCCQAPFVPQLTIPVQLNYGVKSREKVSLGDLSGIAVLFLDTTKMKDEIDLMGHGQPVIWYDHAGESLKVTFVVPDSQATNYLSLLYSKTSCSVGLMRHEKLSNDTLRASGNLVLDPEGYQVYLVGPLGAKDGLKTAINQLNDFFMLLHARSRTTVNLKSWFNTDSLNVIIGSDTQFGTDNDLFWIDQSLRMRIRQLAVNAYSRLYLFENKAGFVKDTLTSFGFAVHTAQADPRDDNGVKGNLSFKVEPDDRLKYLFMKPHVAYLFSVGYSFYRHGSGKGELILEKISCKNLETSDFVDMELTDLVSNGIPLIYVDLIRGVVMEDGGPWDVANIFHALEDIFRLSYLPNE